MCPEGRAPGLAGTLDRGAQRIKEDSLVLGWSSWVGSDATS